MASNRRICSNSTSICSRSSGDTGHPPLALQVTTKRRVVVEVHQIDAPLQDSQEFADAFVKSLWRQAGDGQVDVRTVAHRAGGGGAEEIDLSRSVGLKSLDGGLEPLLLYFTHDRTPGQFCFSFKTRPSRIAVVTKARGTPRQPLTPQDVEGVKGHSSTSAGV